MKVLDSSPAHSAAKAAEKRIQGSAYDDDEKKLIVRFEKGIDFHTFEGFRSVFLQLIRPREHAWAKRQLKRMEQLGIPQQIQSPPGKLQGFDVGIPVELLTDEARIRLGSGIN